MAEELNFPSLIVWFVRMSVCQLGDQGPVAERPGGSFLEHDFVNNLGVDEKSRDQVAYLHG